MKIRLVKSMVIFFPTVSWQVVVSLGLEERKLFFQRCTAYSLKQCPLMRKWLKGV